MAILRKLLLEIRFRIKNIPPHWINKFSIATVFFFIWLSIFDTHNLIERFKLSSQLSRLEKQKKDLIVGIAQAKLDKKDLDSNKEKFAREKYYMHKDNEDVFIIEKKISK